VDEGEVGTGELVVSGREAAVLLEAADQSLDDISLAIGAPIHHLGLRLGLELRDDRGDAAAAEMVADLAAGVAAVGEERLGVARGRILTYVERFDAIYQACLANDFEKLETTTAALDQILRVEAPVAARRNGR